MNSIIDRLRESAEVSQFGVNSYALSRQQPSSEFNITSSLSHRKRLIAESRSWEQTSSESVSRSNSFHAAAPFAFFTRTRVTPSVMPAFASPAHSVLGIPPPPPIPIQARPRSEASAEASAASGKGLSASNTARLEAIWGARSPTRPIGDPRGGLVRREANRKALSLRLPGSSSSPSSDPFALPKRHLAFTLPARVRPSLQTVSLPITRNPQPSTRFFERTTSFIEQADIETLNSLLSVINSRKRRLQEVTKQFSCLISEIYRTFLCKNNNCSLGHA